MSNSPRALLSSLAGPLKDNMQALLSRREMQAIDAAGEPSSPPVFIVGPPRTGTTLVYLFVLRALRTSYFCNLADRFHLWPVQVTRFLANFPDFLPPDSFSSRFGETSGLKSPSPGRHIWIRWFPVDAPQTDPLGPLPPLPEEATQGMQKTVAMIEKIMGGPFVNKTQAHCTRIPNLALAFPNMVIIRVSRDPYFTAQSILAGRKKFFGDEREWFSVKPRNFLDLVERPVLEQVSGQIYYLEKGMDRDLERIPQVPVFNIRYEDFCEAPRKMVADFKEFYREKTGISLRNRFQVPDSFTVSRSDRLSSEVSQELKEHLSRLWGT